MQTEIGKITSKGQTTIPAVLRKELNLMPGDEIMFEREGDKITIRKAAPLNKNDSKTAIKDHEGKGGWNVAFKQH